MPDFPGRVVILPPWLGGGVRHSVRAADHTETAEIRLVLDSHGAHGVTRPSAHGRVNMQEGESPSLAELNASN
jgi:hypothetical protein